MSEQVPRDDAHSFRIDVERIIDSSARRVRAADLEGQVVRVIDPRQIDDAIAQSVDDALRVQEARLGLSLRREVGLQASRRFVDLMGEHQRAMEERREAIRARRDLDKEFTALREQLGAERERFKREQRRRYALSEEGLRELEAHLRRVVSAFVKSQHRRGTLEPGGMGSGGVRELEQTLARVIHRVIVKERLEAFRPVPAAQLEEMVLLERRLADLQKRLTDRESELVELRRRPRPPVHPKPAGTSDMRAGAGRNAVLAVIFNENLKLRESFSQAS